MESTLLWTVSAQGVWTNSHHVDKAKTVFSSRSSCLDDHTTVNEDNSGDESDCGVECENNLVLWTSEHEQVERKWIRGHVF